MESKCFYSCLVILCTTFFVTNANFLVPHCSQASVLQGKVLQENLDSTVITILNTISVKVRFRESICFEIQFSSSSVNSSILLAVTYQSLVQDYPVRQRYQFGIPQLDSDCTCDCIGGDDHCSADGRNHRCHSDKLCYSSFHAHQPATGCPIGRESQLCCNVTVRAFKKLKFWALNLGFPTAFATFRYQVFTNDEGNGWGFMDSKKVSVELRDDQAFSFGDFQMKVSGREPKRMLRPGMYVAPESLNYLLQGVPVYEQNDYSGLHKLGWLRFQKDGWLIRKGDMKLSDAHKVNVLNCKTQLYKDNFNAEYFVRKTSNNSEIKQITGIRVDSFNRWVEKSEVAKRGRSVHIFHKNGPSVNLDLSTTSTEQPVLKFVHHSSTLADFDATLLLDKHSNRFLNATFLGAKGLLFGTVYRCPSKALRENMVFTVGVPSSTNTSAFNKILEVDSSVNSSKFICFHPKNNPDGEICKTVRFVPRPLWWFELPKQNWEEETGSCLTCNQVNLGTFLKYLNPKNWLNGISTLSEALAVGSDILLFIVFVVVFCLLFRCCILPASRYLRAKKR